MTVYATEIRDKAHEIVTALGLFETARVVPTFQWQPEQAPAIGIYLRREQMTPDGDENAGEPTFLHSVIIGVSILTRADDPEQLVTVTDQPANAVIAELLTNTDFLALIEGVTSIDQSPMYAPNASAYITENRIEFTVAFRTDWPPQVASEYTGATLSTRPLGASAATPAIKTRIPAPTA